MNNKKQNLEPVRAQAIPVQKEVPAVQKKWWQSTNFYLAAVLLIGGFFVGFPEGAAEDVVAQLFALVASVGIIRNWAKTKPPTDAKKWVGTSNFWNYLTTLAVTLVPQIPVEAIAHLQSIVESALGGNWQGVIMGLFALATIVYNIVKPKPETAAVAATN